MGGRDPIQINRLHVHSQHSDDVHADLIHSFSGKIAKSLNSYRSCPNTRTAGLADVLLQWVCFLFIVLGQVGVSGACGKGLGEGEGRGRARRGGGKGKKGREGPGGREITGGSGEGRGRVVVH